jgi:RNA polymerase sigma-70 factor (ECF subfamily)
MGPSASDAELLAATRSSAQAFAFFYDRYEAAVAGYFMRRTRDPDIAADLTAEVFASALRAAGRYKPHSVSAASWLFTIAHNTLATSIRRGRVEAAARTRLGLREAVAVEPDSLERVSALAADDSWATELLERLPPEQRDAVRARILEEREYAEIAAELKTSELVVRKRVSRGLASLRNELEGDR